MTYKEILKVAPTLQAANLVTNLSKKRKKKSLIGDATGIIVGSSLIKTEYDLIGEL